MLSSSAKRFRKKGALVGWGFGCMVFQGKTGPSPHPSAAIGAARTAIGVRYESLTQIFNER
jgi:hypothetical protein